jgi:hypothetical protein
LQGIPQGREHDEDREAVNDRITELNDALDELEAKPKSATHTPGPWKFFDGPKPYIGARITKTGFTPIAQILGRDNESEANARLISKAPDMRKVIKTFIDDIEAVGVEHVKSEWPDLLKTYIQACEAIGIGISPEAEGADPQPEPPKCSGTDLNGQTCEYRDFFAHITKYPRRIALTLTGELQHVADEAESLEDGDSVLVCNKTLMTIVQQPQEPRINPEKARSYCATYLNDSEAFRAFADARAWLYELMWEVMESREGESINQD